MVIKFKPSTSNIVSYRRKLYDVTINVEISTHDHLFDDGSGLASIQSRYSNSHIEINHEAEVLRLQITCGLKLVKLF